MARRAPFFHLVIVACLAVTACSGGGGAIGGDAGIVLCTLAGPGCQPGATCDIFCRADRAVTACRLVDAAVDVGQHCPGSGSAMCPMNSGCNTTATSGGPICISYCRSNADCTVGTCQERPFLLRCGPDDGTMTIKLCL